MKPCWFIRGIFVLHMFCTFVDVTPPPKTSEKSWNLFIWLWSCRNPQRVNENFKSRGMAKAKLEFQERLDEGRRGANEKITSVEGGGASYYLEPHISFCCFIFSLMSWWTVLVTSWKQMQNCYFKLSAGSKHARGTYLGSVFSIFKALTLYLVV